MRVAWYRFTATFGRRRGGYLTLVLLIGLIGGVAMGSLAAARRTQSSFATFLASTRPSDLSLTVQGPNLTRKLERLPGVQRVEAALLSLNAFPLTRTGAPIIPRAFSSSEAAPIGSIDGEYFDQDRVTVTSGRMARPDREAEFVATAQAARLLGWHVGEVIPMGFYTNAQAPSSKPLRRLRMRLVGIVVLNNEVVLDDVDRFPAYVLFTPALTRPFITGPEDVSYGLRLAEGPRGVPAAEQEIIRALPNGVTYQFHVTSVVEGQVDRTVRPEAIALAVFGAIAMLAALLISAQVIVRQLQGASEETAVLRALGASRWVVMGDGLFGVLGAVVLGSLLAAGVEVGLSPLSPLGPVRSVYPKPWPAVDGTVLGLGLLTLIAGIGAVAVALAARSAVPRRPGAATRASRGSGLARVAAAAGAPVSAVTGVRFALEPGHGRTAVPVRSALFGAALAVAIVAATLTFGSGLTTLVSHPPLYGWNWSYALEGGPVPPQTLSLLRHDRLVAAWSGVSFTDVQIDRQTVPVIVTSTHAQVTPPILAGHPPEADNQIVLGAATLAQLHKRVGDTVLVSYGAPGDAPVYIPPTPLVIVGTATLPAVGSPQTLHPSMGTGALIPAGIEPPEMTKFLRRPNPTLNGPAAVFVRLRNGVTPAAGLRSLRRIAYAGTRAFQALPSSLYNGQDVNVLPVQYPAEIENYRSIGAAPAFLAAGLAAGAAAALGLTLIASVRRRRRDLALLKALGLTQRQLASCVAWQSTVAAAAGIVAGIPAGVALGRWLWILFAHQIYAVPRATVPAPSLVYVGLGALALAGLVAALPGIYASRTPVALVLRTE
jgi:MacB-like periplasmic core domain/FtsX-like permease family